MKADRYNTVAEAVLKLISLKGLGAVTHTNVSRASGASRPWLYAYLGKTKDSLIEIAAKHLGTIYAGLEREAIVKDPETWLDAQIEDIRDGIQTARRYPWLIPLYFRHRGTQNLLGKVIDDIESIADSASRPLLIYPSSVTVFGYPEPAQRLMRAEDPVAPSDHYTRHKVEIEQRLAASSIPWSVMRVGVSVDSRTLGADLSMMRKLFNVSPDNPLEYVHPCDVATAIVNAIDNPRAIGKIFLLGGGGDCRITQHQFLSAAINALGITLPRDMLGADQSRWIGSTR